MILNLRDKGIIQGKAESIGSPVASEKGMGIKKNHQ